MKGNGDFLLDVGHAVKACYISHVRADLDKGIYVKDKSKQLDLGY